MENGGSNSGNRPTIMVTNDDEIDTPGLRVLVRTLVSVGLYVVQVCAPDSEKSAVGHSTTHRHPVGAKKVEIQGATAFAVFGVSKALFPSIPDLVISGINWASAYEAFLESIPSISMSYDWDQSKSHVNDFTLSPEACLRIVNEIMAEIKNQNYPNGCFLDIEFPTNIANHKIRGLPEDDIADNTDEKFLSLPEDNIDDNTDKKNNNKRYITITPLGVLSPADLNCHDYFKDWLSNCSE